MSDVKKSKSRPFVSTAEQIRREGRAKGEVHALRQLLVRQLGESRQQHIEAVRDAVRRLAPGALGTWVDRLFGTESMKVVRAALLASVPAGSDPEPAESPLTWSPPRSSLVEQLDRICDDFRSEGYEQGKLTALRNVLYRNLHRRFGPTPEHLLAPIRHADVDELLDWLDRFKASTSDEELLAPRD